MRFMLSRAASSSGASLPAGRRQAADPDRPRRTRTPRSTSRSRASGKLDKVKPATSEAELEYRAGIGKYAKNEQMDLTFADEVKVWFDSRRNGSTRTATPRS